MKESAFSGGKKVTFNNNGTYSSGPNNQSSHASGQNGSTGSYFANSGRSGQQPTNNNKKTGLFSSATDAEKRQLKRMAIICVGICVAILLVVFLVLFASKAITGKSLGGTTLGSSNYSAITKDDDADTLAEAVANKCLPSVCSVDVYTSSKTGQSTQSGTGSGVVISKDGYIVTNQHVIDGASSIKVHLGGESLDADLIGQDASSDIAVVKAKNAGDLVPIEIADSDKIKVGEWVMSIGNPFGLEQSVATGIVSATSRSQVVSSSSNGETKVYPNLIQTDAAINPGNSGGALVDKNGQLIGINALIQSSSGNYSGVGFAIPSNYAIDLARQIIDGKSPSHARLGVSTTNVTSDTAKTYGWSVSQGAYVNGVTQGGPAEIAGLKVGDIITKIDDKDITSSSDLLLAVRSHNPGDKISITYSRSNETGTCDAVLVSDEGQTQSTQKSQSNSGSSGNGNSNQYGYDMDDLFNYFFGR